MKTMDFADALKLLQLGAKISRRDWQKGTFIYIAENSVIKINVDRTRKGIIIQIPPTRLYSIDCIDLFNNDWFEFKNKEQQHESI